MGYDKKQFAERLKETCDDKQVAENQRTKALMELTKKRQPSVRAWLVGESLPEPDVLYKIMRWGRTTADYLLYGLQPKIAGDFRASRVARDALEEQLLDLYRQLSGAARDELLASAQRLFTITHPERSKANPFGLPPPPPTRLTVQEPEKRRKPKKKKDKGKAT